MIMIIGANGVGGTKAFDGVDGDDWLMRLIRLSRSINEENNVDQAE